MASAICRRSRHGRAEPATTAASARRASPSSICATTFSALPRSSRARATTAASASRSISVRIDGGARQGLEPVEHAVPGARERRARRDVDQEARQEFRLVGKARRGGIGAARPEAAQNLSSDFGRDRVLAPICRDHGFERQPFDEDDVLLVVLAGQSVTQESRQIAPDRGERTVQDVARARRIGLGRRSALDREVPDGQRHAIAPRRLLRLGADSLPEARFSASSFFASSSFRCASSFTASIRSGTSEV